MLEMFYPRRYEVSTYVIPFDYYHAQGMQGVIFDIDNTLVPHDAPADGQAVELFERLRAMGMKTCLLSNNKERIKGRLLMERFLMINRLRQVPLPSLLFLRW